MSGVSRVENWQDPQDLFIEKEDVGSPDSVSDAYRDHLRLRKLFVNDKSKVCHKVFCTTAHNLGRVTISFRVYIIFSG